MRSLLDFFFGRKPEPEQPAPPVLRNRAGGMAWIKGIADRDGIGSSQLNNRAVKTVMLSGSGKWIIEPAQHFIACRAFVWEGVPYEAGDCVGVAGIVDDCLEPWKDDGVTDEEVETLYAPPLRLKVYSLDDLPRQGQQ
jgi:hypothetical protein